MLHPEEDLEIQSLKEGNDIPLADLQKENQDNTIVNEGKDKKNEHFSENGFPIPNFSNQSREGHMKKKNFTTNENMVFEDGYYKSSSFNRFLNIAYPVGITVLTSTAMGFGMYETLVQCKDLVDKPEALGFIAFSTALVSALILLAMFHGYRTAIMQEVRER